MSTGVVTLLSAACFTVSSLTAHSSLNSYYQTVSAHSSVLSVSMFL